MADTQIQSTKPALQIRNGTMLDKSPSPSTKLLLNHGKPNFTIPRSPKVQDNDAPLSTVQPTINNNYNAFKSANSNINNNNNSSYNNNNTIFVTPRKFNGTSNGNTSENENEVANVVLRRPKPSDPLPPAENGDENVPEFIRRQRQIQERLAKENVLDFENRRSGYFTHVMISPDSPNRTSFVETMASPAIVPALEMPVTLPARIEEDVEDVEQPQAIAAPLLQSEPEPEPNIVEEEEPVTNGHHVEEIVEVAVHSNGHVEEAEAVEAAQLLTTNDHVEKEEKVEVVEVVEIVQTNGHLDDVAADEVAKAIEEVNKAVAGEDDDHKPEVDAEPIAVTSVAVEVENGHHNEDITISHTNGHTDGPSIPPADPSGALGVNYEPKTVVSFAQELGGGENNYPDTVKVIKEVSSTPVDSELHELTKLKFDIQEDGQNEVQVTPVLRTE